MDTLNITFNILFIMSPDFNTYRPIYFIAYTSVPFGIEKVNNWILLLIPVNTNARGLQCMMYWVILDMMHCLFECDALIGSA